MADPAPIPLARLAAQTDGPRLFFHATAVVLGGHGVLILGGSGAGKSSLALDLMAHGAALICDDGVWVSQGPTGPSLERPPKAPNLIEARGIGLLQAGPIEPEAALSLVVDLDRAEPKRLPPRRMVTFGNRSIEVIFAQGHPGLAPALLQMLRHGRAQP